MSAPGLSPDLGPDLSHVETWIFDLDNTLYPPECEFMALIDARMTDFVMRTAPRLRAWWPTTASTRTPSSTRYTTSRSTGYRPTAS
jgi:FMN phosphatase YigB (HAD superfamily)